MYIKRRIIVGVLLYLIGAALFIISNSSVVSGSPIALEYFERIILCSAAVITLAAAPFVYKTKTLAGTIVQFVIAAALICCIIIFNGFEDNRIAASSENSTDNYDLLRADAEVEPADLNRSEEELLHNFIKSGNALALVEVEEVRPFLRGDQALCRVEKDYYDNLNYKGSDEGYIYIYTDEGAFSEGERRYLVLQGMDILVYPHIVYAPRDGGFDMFENEDGTISIEETKGPIAYDITNDTDIDALFTDIAQSSKTPFIEFLERPGSYSEMLNIADNALRVKIIGMDEKSEYFYTVTFIILDEDVTGEYEKGENYIQYLTNANECEIDGEYMLFLYDGQCLGDYALMPYAEYLSLTAQAE